jgi:uncharacterized protein (DUF111 family)
MSFSRETVSRIETNLDDVSPEISGAVLEDLFEAGALDVWFTPIQMKKNRPGILLSLLCKEEATDRMAEILFRQTTAFGLRIEKIERLVLERRFETVRTPYGEVTMKIGFHGNEILQASPEFESCRSVSRSSGQTLRAVYLAAQTAFARVLSPLGAPKLDEPGKI